MSAMVTPACGEEGTKPGSESGFVDSTEVSPSGAWRQSDVAEKPMNQQTRYLAYLLRLWEESGGSPPDAPHDEPPMWRASLEHPRSGEHLGFASLADLFAFLQHETGPSSPGSEQSEAEGR